MRGGSVLRTEPRYERQRAEGEHGVQPPELSKRQTGKMEREKERKRDQKVQREHVALSAASAEQCNRNSNHRTSSSSRSNVHAVT